MVSKINPDKNADMDFSIADTPAGLDDHFFRKLLEKSGTERLIIGCNMADSARQLV